MTDVKGCVRYFRSKDLPLGLLQSQCTVRRRRCSGESISVCFMWLCDWLTTIITTEYSGKCQVFLLTCGFLVVAYGILFIRYSSCWNDPVTY